MTKDQLTLYARGVTVIGGGTKTPLVSRLDTGKMTLAGSGPGTLTWTFTDHTVEEVIDHHVVSSGHLTRCITKMLTHAQDAAAGLISIRLAQDPNHVLLIPSAHWPIFEAVQADKP